MERRNQKYKGFIAATAGLIVGMFLFSIYVTLFINIPPISITNEKVVASNFSDGIKIKYIRDLRSFSNFFATRVVRLSCGNSSYSLQDSIHFYMKEEFSEGTETTYFASGFNQPVGTDCEMKRIIIWHPLLSWEAKAYNLEILNFKVQ